MIKSILVSFDGSPSSESALMIASSVAGIAGAKLKVLFIEDQRRFMHYDLSASVASAAGVQPVFPVPLPPDKMLVAEAAIDTEYQKLLQIVSERLSAAHVKGIFQRVRGFPAEVIIEASRAADFVIIGNHGKHKGVEYVEHGFTTNSLLHGTTRPVLVVPEDPSGASALLIAYDGSATAERTLRFAAEFATLTEIADVHLLAVEADNQHADQILKPAVEYLQAYEFDVHICHAKGKAHEEILRLAQQVDASILAIGAFGKKSLASKLFGSTTTPVLQQAQCAVLLLP